MTPTAGRIVHFFPGKYHKENEFKDKLNSAEFLPAIVTQAWGGHLCNIVVITPFWGTISLGSVSHKDEVLDGSYWDWPARN